MTTRHMSRRKPRKKPTETTPIDWSAAQKRACKLQVEAKSWQVELQRQS